MRWILVEAQRPRDARGPARRSPTSPTRELRGRGIEIRTSTTLEEVDERLRAADGRRDDPDAHRRVDRRRQAASGRRRARPAARRRRPDRRRRVRCRSRAATNVWAIGDAAAVPDPARKGQAVAADRPARDPPGPRVARNVAAALGAGGRQAVHATGRSACSSTWAATRRSPDAGHPLARLPRLVPRPHATTWRSCRARSARRACSSTGPSRCSSAATRASSASSATRRGWSSTRARPPTPRVRRSDGHASTPVDTRA